MPSRVGAAAASIMCVRDACVAGRGKACAVLPDRCVSLSMSAYNDDDAGSQSRAMTRLHCSAANAVRTCGGCMAMRVQMPLPSATNTQVWMLLPPPTVWSLKQTAGLVNLLTMVALKLLIALNDGTCTLMQLVFQQAGRGRVWVRVD